VIKLLASLFRRKPRIRRVDFVVCKWADAHTYLDKGYSLAPEEDRNRQFGIVYLEKLERV
jgi:hypothetical protein